MIWGDYRRLVGPRMRALELIFTEFLSQVLVHSDTFLGVPLAPCILCAAVFSYLKRCHALFLTHWVDLLPYNCYSYPCYLIHCTGTIMAIFQFPVYILPCPYAWTHISTLCNWFFSINSGLRVVAHHPEGKAPHLLSTPLLPCISSLSTFPRGLGRPSWTLT